MNPFKTVRYAVITALLTTVLVYANPQESPAPKQSEQSVKLELRISDDGKAIVDQHGKEVARFVQDVRINTQKEGQTKAMHAQAVQAQLVGCMRCTNECIR
jgi:hypothetical protein